MSSELVVVLRCDHIEIVQGTKAVPCEKIAVIKECATFIDYNEYSRKPYVALDYITPLGWHRVKGISHFCPVHAELKRNQKYNLPDFKAYDTLSPTEEEPTRKIRISSEEYGPDNKNRKK
jgi:hypothetical protein